MLRLAEQGLYCEPGGFFIDPPRAVDRALITHAHSDHARPGSASYLAAQPGLGVLRHRLGGRASIQGLPYGESTRVGEVRVSFHPAGHVLGSAQIRLEHRGEVWVVSGDYKRQPDPTCAPFEPVPCHVFVTESTFGLPFYRWPDPARVFDEINAWWRGNQQSGRSSLLLGYSLGKAQRLLAGLDPSIGPIRVHPAIAELLPAYAAAGVALPNVDVVDPDSDPSDAPCLLVAPPGSSLPPSHGGGDATPSGVASGWMLVRAARKQRGAARGFVLSDHADWPGLVDTIQETGAGRVLVTHGSTSALVRWLNETGREATALATRLVGEPESTPDPGHHPAPS